MKKILFILITVFLYSNEARIALDYAKTKDFLNESAKCSDSDFSGCENMQKDLKIQNVEEAKKYIKQLCKEQDYSACYTYSQFSEDEYERFNSLRLACQNHFELACTELVLKYQTNKTKALKLLQNQCENENNYNSCHYTALFYKAFLDKNNALKYSDKACDKGFYNSCTIKAQILLEQNEEKSAIKELKDTCNKGYKEACRMGAMIQIRLGNFKDSKKYLEKLCELGDEASCKKLKGF